MFHSPRMKLGTSLNMKQNREGERLDRMSTANEKYKNAWKEKRDVSALSMSENQAMAFFVTKISIFGISQFALTRL